MEAILTYRSIEETFTDHGFRVFVSLEIPPDAHEKFIPGSGKTSFGLGTQVRVSNSIPPGHPAPDLRLVSTQTLLDELATRITG